MFQIRSALQPGRSQDAIAKLWAQLIQEVKPKLVITTGTAGGIGSAMELGDVVAAQAVRFDCTQEGEYFPPSGSKATSSDFLETGTGREDRRLDSREDAGDSQAT
jgi:purine-nucleoside phosphorylase